MTLVETALAELLLRIFPFPVVWALGFAIVLGAVLLIRKVPSSASALLFTLPVSMLAKSIAGGFTLLYIGIILCTAVVLFWAVQRLGRSQG